MDAKLRAIEIERSLARGDLHLELGQPASRDSLEGHPRREWKLTVGGSKLKRLPLVARLGKSHRANGAETRPSLDHHADRIPSVRLPIDATLYAHAPLSTIVGHAGSSVRGSIRGE
jgi:hypothetical protein